MSDQAFRTEHDSMGELQVPADAPAGVYTNTTSTVSGTTSGLGVSGPAASDDIQKSRRR